MIFNPLYILLVLIPNLKSILKFIDRVSVYEESHGAVCLFSTLKTSKGHLAFRPVYKKNRVEEEYSMNHQESSPLENIVSFEIVNQEKEEHHDSPTMNKTAKFEKSAISFVINTYLGGYFGSETASEDSLIILKDSHNANEIWKLKH